MSVSDKARLFCWCRAGPVPSAVTDLNSFLPAVASSGTSSSLCCFVPLWELSCGWGKRVEKEPPYCRGAWPSPPAPPKTLAKKLGLGPPSRESPSTPLPTFPALWKTAQEFMVLLLAAAGRKASPYQDSFHLPVLFPPPLTGGSFPPVVASSNSMNSLCWWWGRESFQVKSLALFSS